MPPCKKCGAPVVWRRTTHGKMMPVNPRPDDDGNLVADVLGLLYVAPPDERESGKTFMPHWATCGKKTDAKAPASQVTPATPCASCGERAGDETMVRYGRGAWRHIRCVQDETSSAGESES